MKIAMFAYHEDITCFAHVLINGLDLAEKGHEVKIIMEGKTTGLLDQLTERDRPFSQLFKDAMDKGLIDCVCRACAGLTNSIPKAEELGLELRGEVMGHPGISEYMENGYEIMVF